MSHVAKIELEIKDLDALAKAAASLGLELVRGQKNYRWYGRHVGDYPLPQGFTREDLGSCEHAIRVPGSDRAYEIGVVQRRDGKAGYTLLWDFWQGGYGLQAKVGSDGQKLRQAYTTEAAVANYTRKGFRVQRTTKEGRVIITATR
jgi:hypothetical protein